MAAVRLDHLVALGDGGGRQQPGQQHLQQRDTLSEHPPSQDIVHRYKASLSVPLAFLLMQGVASVDMKQSAKFSLNRRS